MGGLGSGRPSSSFAHDKTDDYRSIDIRRLKRDGYLKPYLSYNWQWTRNNEVFASVQVKTEPDKVILTYKHRGYGKDWKNESYPVYIDWTDCHLGGKRPWFLCPAVGCGSRVAILYGGGIFACRKCHQLAYPSQREAIDDRACRRAERIRDKLGWAPGILNSRGSKPKGMHWKTYLNLCRQHDAFVQISLTEMEKRFQLLGESVDDWQ
jgi:Zn-finger protein